MTYTPPEKIKELAKEAQSNPLRDASLLIPPLSAFALSAYPKYGIWGIALAVLLGSVSVGLAQYFKK